MNALVMSRGEPEDYDRWEALGATGWAFARLEAAFAAADRALPSWRPPPEAWSPLERGVADAALDLGHPWCPDDRVVGSTGVGPAALSVRGGRRVSTNDAYLEPARRQGNLRVRGDTLVDRVLLDAGRAVGVRTAGGEELAADGVVVAAGAIHSPAILLRSGLERRGIGANLCDHASVAVHVSIRAESRSEPGNPALSQLLRFSSGMADAAVNDLQLTTVTAAGPGDRRHGSIQVALMQVFSRGRVALHSHDATEDPDVRFDLLSDDRDRVRLRHGACRLLEIARHPAVADHVDGVLWEPGGTAVGGALDDVALDAWLDAGVGDYVHAAGTCRMGRPDDADAVVDPDGAVIGTEGLWVVDASVMPDLPRANTHLPTVMLAERLSERLARRT